MTSNLPKDWWKQPSGVLEMWMDNEILEEDDDFIKVFDELYYRENPQLLLARGPA